MATMETTDKGVRLTAVTTLGEFTADFEQCENATEYCWLNIKIKGGKLQLLMDRKDVCGLLSACEAYLVFTGEGQQHLSNKTEGNIVPVLDSIASGGNG